MCGNTINFNKKKNNEGINGIVVNDKEHVISQFADDTTLVLDGSQKSLISALETLEYYAQISVLRINNSKTKLIWIGSKKHSKEETQLREMNSILLILYIVIFVPAYFSTM